MAVSSDIEAKANSVRTAIKGKDVREALASGIEDIDIVAEDTKSRQDTVEADFTSIQNSEATRISNENTRQENEKTRQTNETSRQNAESTRTTNEETRQSNESTRQSNEATRQNTINAMKVCEPYDNSKEYFQFNKTVYQGSTYECIVESVIGVYPNADNTKWLCIAQKGQDGAGGDMFKSTYDSTNNGIVDNSEKLGGQLPSYYTPAEDFANHTSGTATQAHKAKNILVEDTANHFTSTTKNIENVLTELFTSASNGKTAIATATGLPSTNTDTFNQLATNISSSKDNIYNAIIAKGTTPASKSFVDLTNAITNISTGRKFRTGKTTSTVVNDGVTWYDYITVSGLGFTPHFIFVAYGGYSRTAVYISFRSNGAVFGYDSAVNGDELYTKTGVWSWGYTEGGNSDGFIKTVAIARYSISPGTYNWAAIE